MFHGRFLRVGNPLNIENIFIVSCLQQTTFILNPRPRRRRQLQFPIKSILLKKSVISKFAGNIIYACSATGDIGEL